MRVNISALLYLETDALVTVGVNTEVVPRKLVVVTLPPGVVMVNRAFVAVNGEGILISS